MKVFKAMLSLFVLVVTSIQIASSSICCEDIESEVEEKELAYSKLCSTVTSDLENCCEDLETYVERQRKAYETLCPENDQFLANFTNLGTTVRPGPTPLGSDYVGKDHENIVPVTVKNEIQFDANFTNLGATGRLGPTSLGSHYVGKDHENMVTVENGTQFWTVPSTGTYEITAVGAAGGYDKYSSSAARGRGAYMEGNFDFTKGDVIKILVGQEGVKNTVSYSAGGGGGSFVATSSNTPLIIAGGGGGIEGLTTRLVNCDASTGTFGRQNECKPRCPVTRSGGVNGSGALEADIYRSGGGGGGGFYSNGRIGKGAEEGKGFIQGGAGGRGLRNYLDGGFGGGGGANGAAGGGGGYSGGASGEMENDSCGGGGGSYNIGKNQVNKEEFWANGDGYVEIRRLP